MLRVSTCRSSTCKKSTFKQHIPWDKWAERCLPRLYRGLVCLSADYIVQLHVKLWTQAALWRICGLGGDLNLSSTWGCKCVSTPLPVLEVMHGMYSNIASCGLTQAIRALGCGTLAKSCCAILYNWTLSTTIYSVISVMQTDTVRHLAWISTLLHVGLFAGGVASKNTNQRCFTCIFHLNCFPSSSNFQYCDQRKLIN